MDASPGPAQDEQSSHRTRKINGGRRKTHCDA